MPRGSLPAAPVIDELLLPDEVEDYAANKSWWRKLCLYKGYVKIAKPWSSILLVMFQNLRA